ncbi:MAG: GPH family glycoside/pentoside/hexuronide:cation symporter [Halieaceae bacterium]|jgi:GPH family glycoside/pentoside/hexuronide:cation symporter
MLKSRTLDDDTSLEREVPWHSMAAFGVGCVADNIKNFAWDLFILFFYTQVLGLSGTLTGLALLVALVFDAISDPYVGFLSDRARGLPLGRRHSFMLFATVPFALCFYTLFTPPEGLGQLGLFAWLVTFGVLSRFFMTFFAVPIRAVGAELSRDVSVRPKIIAYGALGLTLGRVSLPVIAFSYFFVANEQYSSGQLDPANYPPFAVAFSIICVATMLIGIAGTYGPIREIEALEADAPRPRIGPLEGIKALVSAMTVTPNVRWSFILALVVFFSIVSISVLKVHIVTYLWQTPPDLTKWIVSAQYIGTGISSFMLPFLFKRIDRKLCISVGMAGFTVLSALAVLLPMYGVLPPPASRELGYILIGIFLIAGLLLGVYFIAIGALSADVADEHEVNTGRRQQALIGGFGMFAIKAAGGLMTLFTGVFLDLIAFPVGAPVGSVPAEKVAALGHFSAGLCILGAVFVLLTVSRLDTSLAKQQEINRRLLATMRAGASEVPTETLKD